MIFLTFSRAYPWPSFLMVAALLLAGLAEGSSLSLMLPLISFAVDKEAGLEPENQSEFTQTVTQVLQSVGITPSIGNLLIVVVLGVLLKSMLLLVANKQVGYTKARMATDLRLKLLNSILTSRWSYFVHQPVGRLTNSMATEAWRASDAYEFGAGMVAYGIQALVYMSVALMVSWKATLSALAAALVFLYVSHFLVKMTRRAGRRQTHLLKSLLTRMTDTLNSVKTLKAMGRENLADKVLGAETDKLNKALEKEVFSKAALSAAQEPMFAAVGALAIFILLERWGLPVAEVLVLTVLLTRVLAHLGKIQKHFQKVVTAESAYYSLMEAVDDAVALKEEHHGLPAPELDDRIELDGVSFEYDGKPILRNLSLSIPSGQLTTIIGRSGSGKTTIIDMLAGLQAPSAGRVLIDGVSLSEINLGDWRHKIGYAPQDTVLLHDTILNNVTLGDPDLDEADARRALEQADAWEFVAAMPDGMETSVGERGARVSAGQRQRIMLARALAHQPRLLILDEATSALDPDSEAAICETLRGLRGQLTIVAVSHQPALAEFADAVYRLSEGRLEDSDAPGRDPHSAAV
jgi:ATP-binding cassette subfamily C protein